MPSGKSTALILALPSELVGPKTSELQESRIQYTNPLLIKPVYIAVGSSSLIFILGCILLMASYRLHRHASRDQPLIKSSQIDFNGSTSSKHVGRSPVVVHNETKLRTTVTTKNTHRICWCWHVNSHSSPPSDVCASVDRTFPTQSRVNAMPILGTNSTTNSTSLIASSLYQPVQTLPQDCFNLLWPRSQLGDQLPTYRTTPAVAVDGPANWALESGFSKAKPTCSSVHTSRNSIATMCSDAANSAIYSTVSLNTDGADSRGNRSDQSSTKSHCKMQNSLFRMERHNLQLSGSNCQSQSFRQPGTGATSSGGEEVSDLSPTWTESKRMKETMLNIKDGLITENVFQMNSTRMKLSSYGIVGLTNFRTFTPNSEDLVTPYAEFQLHPDINNCPNL